MIFKNNCVGFYYCKDLEVHVETEVEKPKSYSFSPSLYKKKFNRPFVVCDGITHYNRFNLKPFNLQQFTRTKKKNLSANPGILINPPKKVSSFLPKLNTLKIQVQLKSSYYKKPSNKIPIYKDESLSTEDLTIL